MMKITKKQLRRIIREAEGSTKKYDDDSALRGGQSRLPDSLQRGIIDKSVEDREEREEEEREEKNESVRITRRQLRRIIKEEKTRLTKEAVAQDDEQLLDEVEGRLRKALDEFITIYDEYLGYDVPMHTIRRRIDDVVGDAMGLTQN